ncbi:MAG: ATP-dependent DNA helicase UvrD2, partial [Actinomycetota bacterium]|nr:ATP-dependent DNA helicase UvrD2 [Actinomycetota bacterium]
MPVPGPAALGRGVIISSGSEVPDPWRDAPVVTIDDVVLADPSATVRQLHEAWYGRRSVVIALGLDPVVFREPQSVTVEPWRLTPGTEPWFDRLHFLVWSNTYDARAGEPVWWWSVKAARIGDGIIATPDGPGDIMLVDGTPVWVDGGPRRPWAPVDVDGLAVVHAESVELGGLGIVPDPAPPTAELADDQLAAVAHVSGPARVIAPAGSGKTRVLTERLRHLHVGRRYEPGAVLAVAYNKQAQLEMEARTVDFGPRVRTLNSLGLWVLAGHRRSSPPVIEERGVRRLVETLIPGKLQRRSNTDPIGPYVEGLTAIRLGLTDPEIVESSRDDVPGLAVVFPKYRRLLAERGAVDFDEQIYAAVEVLLGDGPYRRAMQRSCRHLLVDEFQDLTPAHVLMLRLLALPGLDVFGVGDDDQCIYGHAGADPAFLIDYAELFPGAADHPLNVNYRCPTEVVSAASTLLGYNHRRVSKQITAGPANESSAGTLLVLEHGSDGGAVELVDVVRSWLAEPTVEPASIAVLSRVNSLLLAPHVALHEAGVPMSSVLTPVVLERTGMRAALAYLRIAASSTGIDPADIVEILRRPTRGLPQWFPDRLARRAAWTVNQLRAIADQVPAKDAAKVLRLTDDLHIVTDAGRAGTTRQVLEAVRDDIGLGSAMSLLDRTGGGQGSSHLDDLEGLLGVADLHPDPGGFEAWLSQSFQREADPSGVKLSTIHRVKGREWNRVVVFGVADGVVPHRLAEDVEEERRVLHVAITRGRHRVAVLADRTRRSSFLDEMAGIAAKPPHSPHVPTPGVARPVAKSTSPVAIGIEATRGLTVKVLGGYEGEIDAIDGRTARVRMAGGGTLTVRFGERVEHDGRRAPLVAPSELWGAAADAEAALRAWRTGRSQTDGVPAYIVVNDKHLRGIALAQPTSPAELVACDGIGPAKLERYGDEIL